VENQWSSAARWRWQPSVPVAGNVLGWVGVPLPSTGTPAEYHGSNWFGDLFGPFDREGGNVLGKLYIFVCQFNLLTFCSWNVSVGWTKGTAWAVPWIVWWRLRGLIERSEITPNAIGYDSVILSCISDSISRKEKDQNFSLLNRILYHLREILYKYMPIYKIRPIIINKIGKFKFQWIRVKPPKLFLCMPVKCLCIPIFFTFYGMCILTFRIPFKLSHKIIGSPSGIYWNYTKHIIRRAVIRKKDVKSL